MFWIMRTLFGAGVRGLQNSPKVPASFDRGCRKVGLHWVGYMVFPVAFVVLLVAMFH